MIYGAETLQYGFIKTRTLQAETSKGWFVWVSLYRDNREMKKSLKLFSFKIILVNAAYSLVNKTVFGVIAAKLASRAEKCDSDLMIFQDERVIVNILTFAAATFTRASWEFEF